MARTNIHICNTRRHLLILTSVLIAIILSTLRSGDAVEGSAITCFGVSASSTSVCSGNGTCTSVDTCQCNELATGTQCEIAKCFGYSPDDPLVCSGHGKCKSSGFCSCNKGYLGIDCSVPRCFQITSNSATVCSGRGTCISPNLCKVII